MREQTSQPRTPPSGRAARAERRAVEALRLMREGKSLTAAARTAKTDPRTLKKYGAEAIRQEDLFYAPTPTDRLRRRMRVLTPKGLKIVDVWSSKTASRVAQHMAAFHHYLKTNDSSRLAPFRGVRFRVRGEVLTFVTDLRTLERLAHAGEVSFEDLYENVR